MRASEQEKPETKDLYLQNAQWLKWLKEHWAEVGLGTFAWPIAAGTCVVLSVLSRILRRRYGIAGVRGSFSTMRTSEWLVWAAIAVAGLFFAERTWPSLTLRLISWNGALALSAIYWMNGLSIMIYAVGALRQHVMMYLALVALLIALGMHPVLCLIGLFDTWADFRGALDRIVAAIKRRPPPGVA
jgi:uncharacterized protein YybS (DUF2232 family)